MSRSESVSGIEAQPGSPVALSFHRNPVRRSRGGMLLIWGGVYQWYTANSRLIGNIMVGGFRFELQNVKR